MDIGMSLIELFISFEEPDSMRIVKSPSAVLAVAMNLFVYQRQSRLRL